MGNYLCLVKGFLLNSKYDYRNLNFRYHVRYDVRKLCPKALKERGAQNVRTFVAVTACLTYKKYASIFIRAHYRSYWKLELEGWLVTEHYLEILLLKRVVVFITTLRC